MTIQKQLEKKQGKPLSFEKALLVMTMEMVQKNGGISPRTMGLLSKVLEKDVSRETVNLVIKALGKRDVIRVAAVVRSIQ